MNHKDKNNLATRMNGGIRHGRFDSPAWRNRQKMKHLMMLMKRGIRYSKFYKCSTLRKGTY